MRSLLIFFCLLLSYQSTFCQAESRINITSFSSNINTGQDYTPWLNDNVGDLVTNVWQSINFQYVDITLPLERTTEVTKLSLYDYQGVFTDAPAYIYAQSGTQQTLLGVFTGETYLNWVNIIPTNPVLADAIVVHKYGNNIPMKIKIFGIQTQFEVQSTVLFPELVSKSVGDAPFALNATSNNTTTPITYTSSNPSIVSVSNNAGIWKATIVGAGIASIKASQAGGTGFAAATDIIRAQVVLPSSYKLLPGKIEAESYTAMFGIYTENTGDVGGGQNVGYIDEGDWMDYRVKVSTAGTYVLNLRIASPVSTGVIEVKNEAGAILSTVSLPSTGGWQAYTTVSSSITLAAGLQVIRIYTKNAGWNINWFEVATQTQAVIDFAALANKRIGDPSYVLHATSTNTTTPITFTSSNPSVVAVSNTLGGWKATVVATGIADIGASQMPSTIFTGATTTQQQTVVAIGSSITIFGKIPIDSSRWYQLNNTSGSLSKLFDEHTDERPFVGWGLVLPNFDAYYPLRDGESMTIDSIKMYDGVNSCPEAPMTLSVITEDWQKIPIATFTGSQYLEWVGPYPDRISGDNKFKLDVPVSNARYLVINTNWIYPTELQLYGTYTSTNNATPYTKKSVKLKQTFGVNAFEWDFEDGNNPQVINEAKMLKIKKFTGVRHYMDWQRLELQQGSFTYNPTYEGGWNYDTIYQRCKEEGIEVLACLKTIPGWMSGSYPSSMQDAENVPVKYGKDFTDPFSYIEQARIAFQYAARYGNNTNVNPSLLSVNSSPRWGGDPINVVKIGMGVIKYIECDNERDKWWKGRKAYQTGREYAANLSAFYDGHKNTMGSGVGVKNADTSMNVVIGGLAGPNIDYVKGMVDWCKQYRGYKPDGNVNLCWDIINYHQYAGISGNQYGTSDRGAAPEIAKVDKDAREFMQVAHEYCYDMPVWISELGYDINQGSPLRAIAIGGKSIVETQADWILRSSLLYAREGVERVFFYQMYDDNINNPTQFSSMGIADKAAANYLSQTNKLFGEFSYKETISTNPIIDRYELDGRSAYMLVVPDEIGRTMNYTLDLNGADSVYIYKPQLAGSDMSLQKQPLIDGKLNILVSETPVFVLPSNENVERGAESAHKINDTEIAVLGAKSVDLVVSEIRLYPNPTAGVLNIYLNSGYKGKIEFQVNGAMNGIRYSTTLFSKINQIISEKLDLTTLPFGEYILKVRQGHKEIIRKFIKTK